MSGPTRRGVKQRPVSADAALDRVLVRIRACRLCEAHLPLGPRPVVRASTTARLLIVGQAPGTKVHASGIPWNDRSGDRLRDWLGIERDLFYDERRIAIVPMGFCYPGVDANGGDRPPRPECAPLWHPELAPHLTRIGLTLLIGQYAQRYYLGPRRKAGMTETVMAWRDYLPEFLPLPHPSWRNTTWLKRNPWFETELVLVLRERVRELVGDGDEENPPPLPARRSLGEGGAGGGRGRGAPSDDRSDRQEAARKRHRRREKALAPSPPQAG